MSEALRDALRIRAVALSQAVLDRMYENPFWMERYGVRGRRFADEDSLHHVSYLDAAVAANEPQVFTKYATWLRSVLVARGMCSEHLAENFRLLGEAIATAHLPDASSAIAILEAGSAALRYDVGMAGRLQAHVPELVEAIATTPGGAAMRADDRRYLVSYLLDGVATGTRAHMDVFAARCPADAVSALTGAFISLASGPSTEAERPIDSDITG